MIRSRAAALWFLVWAGCFGLSLRPLGAVERGLDVALSPLRFAAELASPLELVRGRAVAAAEQELARSAEAEAAEGARAVAELAARALPADPELRAGRRFVPGEVIGRERGNQDRCWVEVRDLRGVEPGCPVASGEAYVGRVLETRPDPSSALPGRSAFHAEGSVLIELVTASSFRVGARVEAEEEIFLTAGGLFAPSRVARARAVRLAVHQPSSSALSGGLARVHELFAEEGEHAVLAEGFRLGAVQRQGERGPWWIEPELDYEDGLFQVVIATRSDPALPVGQPPAPALGDRYWLATGTLSLGDPSPWRSTVKIPVGRLQGVEPGAAVSGVGARLLGRVARAGLLSSDVALLADPAFSLAAVAHIEGQDEPFVLGRLVSLGRGNVGSVRFRWFVRVPLAAPADPASPADGGELVSARLFSGSGDPGLPAGLFLGEARLPRSAESGEEREIELVNGVDPSDVRALFVRLPRSIAAGQRP